MKRIQFEQFINFTLKNQKQLNRLQQSVNFLKNNDLDQNQIIREKAFELYNNLDFQKLRKAIDIFKISQQKMFVVEALYPFSSAILKAQYQTEQNQNIEKSEISHQNNEQSQQFQKMEQSGQAQNAQKVQNLGQTQEKRQIVNNANNTEQKQEKSEITYLIFQKGDKILVLQSYDNGWWYGQNLKLPGIKGFFPSNYIQTSAKPKPPPPPPESHSEQEHLQNNEKELEKGVDWVQNELKKITQGPVKSDYYLGIKGYKNVKIDEKNQNVLKGDHVKFDVSTGLAKVPVKDQAPVAKAVRQMGYYFDYHQWNEERNKQPNQKARPDPKKKKIKKLNLKGMK